MRIVLLLVASAVLAPLGCNLVHTEEPKQRTDWTAPPTRYGNTQFEGLRAPGAAAPDAGPVTQE